MSFMFEQVLYAREVDYAIAKHEEVASVGDVHPGSRIKGMIGKADDFSQRCGALRQIHQESVESKSSGIEGWVAEVAAFEIADHLVRAVAGLYAANDFHGVVLAATSYHVEQMGVGVVGPRHLMVASFQGLWLAFAFEGGIFAREAFGHTPGAGTVAVTLARPGQPGWGQGDAASATYLGLLLPAGLARGGDLRTYGPG